MRAERVRRLVVVDPKDQRLVGMLSLADLARQLSGPAAPRQASVTLSGLLRALSERRPGTPESPAGPRALAERAAE
jgi:CBS domain-containing protein